MSFVETCCVESAVEELATSLPVGLKIASRMLAARAEAKRFARCWSADGRDTSAGWHKTSGVIATALALLMRYGKASAASPTCSLEGPGVEAISK